MSRKKILVYEYFLKSGDLEDIILKLGSGLISVIYPLKLTYGEVNVNDLVSSLLKRTEKRCLLHIGDMSKGSSRRKKKIACIKLDQIELCNGTYNLLHNVVK